MRRHSSSTFTLCLLVCLSLLLSGCSELTEAIDDLGKRENLRPVGSPDLVILDFAGRCGGICGAPENNRAYLDDADNRTLQALTEMFTGMGYSTQAYGYAATVAGQKNNHSHPGYWDAQNDLNWVYQNWIAGFDNPTRLVLAGHSNGMVWASLLAMENLLRTRAKNSSHSHYQFQ